MHPFVHAFNPAILPRRGRRKTDWDAFIRIAEAFSRLAATHLGVRHDLVAAPLLHDTPDEIAQPFGEVRDWKAGECEPIPGTDHAEARRGRARLRRRGGQDDGARAAAWNSSGTRDKGVALEARRRGGLPAAAERRGPRRRRRRAAVRWPRRARLRGDPRPVGHDERPAGASRASRRSKRAPACSSRTSPSDARGRADHLRRHPNQPRTVITSPEWSGIEAQAGATRPSRSTSSGSSPGTP